jgi:hypothetical protein
VILRLGRYCLVGVLAVGLSLSARALPAPPVVDGDMWANSSPEVRKAFIVGASNMIALESAYSKKKGTPAPTAGIMATAALDGLTLDEISSRITRWYLANPDRRNMPAIGVLWIDMVQPAGTVGTGQ